MSYNKGNSSKNVTGASVVDGTLENADFADNGLSGDKIDGGTISNFTSTGIDDNATSTAITIDASENVLVGKTVTSSDTAGMLIGANGRFDAIRDGGYVGYFNRLSSDGDIALFAKDGTTVGSIGSSTSGLYIHSTFGTDSGLVFGAERIVSCTSTGDFEDGLVDLGYGPSGRFKDLYLSGNADIEGNLVIGTSGKGIDFSADGNAAGMTSEVLDDYETGTWTATLRGNSAEPATLLTATGTQAVYTKIGNTVTIRFRFSNANTTGYSGGIEVQGMPFSAANSEVPSVISYNMASWTGQLGCEVVGNKMVFLDVRTSNTWIAANHAAGTGRYLYASVTFKI